MEYIPDALALASTAIEKERAMKVAAEHELLRGFLFLIIPSIL